MISQSLSILPGNVLDYLKWSYCYCLLPVECELPEDTEICLSFSLLYSTSERCLYLEQSLAQSRHGYPLLFQSSVYTTWLLWRTCISACFQQMKVIQRGFLLLWNSIQCLFCSKPPEVAHPPPAVGVAPPSSFPRHSASQHQAAAVALNRVCELLCCLSIYFVHPLAGCVLKSLLLCFKPFWFRKGFLGMLYFHIVLEGDTCTQEIVLEHRMDEWIPCGFHTRLPQAHHSYLHLW